ncbi:hypothetical protein GUJ93_ZPchr0005g15395 [Zizania palustris]|uniref:Uncharacterized protein n=1 Tax=Zizania palustris TaxID=103762 RepID=A0A8J5SL66_ZIZPA|nr:hypothetical protein GUJ93_ZPchr0005g16263 [Zizania palustris]KAG8067874.1 hypothetical protein GUJ93_ZPchr0005g15395 [Zizania palustris]
MGGSRRKFKRSHAKVRVGMPRRKPREFKPAFDLPEALAAAAAAAEGGGHVPSWDAEGSVVKNYAAFGVVANPNLLGAHARASSRAPRFRRQTLTPLAPHSTSSSSYTLAATSSPMT